MIVAVLYSSGNLWSAGALLALSLEGLPPLRSQRRRPNLPQQRATPPFFSSSEQPEPDEARSIAAQQAAAYPGQALPAPSSSAQKPASKTVAKSTCPSPGRDPRAQPTPARKS
jgi:hypothetical protein